MEYTYEKTDSAKTIYETYEWDNAWIEQANDKERKRVFYIGDSISCQTRSVANSMAEGNLLFDGFGTSKGIDNPYFKKSIALFASQLPAVDTVLFNNGLHGWHLSEEAYEEYYEDMVTFLLEQFEGKKLYVVLTTAVSDQKRMERIQKRNDAAKRTAARHNLPVIDLYSVTLNNIRLLSNDGVHGTEALYKTMAAVILNSLNQ